MERNEMQGTRVSGDISDTIAFGSMLVFASVMPPLGPDDAGLSARSEQQRSGVTDTNDPIDGIQGRPSAGQCSAHC